MIQAFIAWLHAVFSIWCLLCSVQKRDDVCWMNSFNSFTRQLQIMFQWVKLPHWCSGLPSAQSLLTQHHKLHPQQLPGKGTLLAVWGREVSQYQHCSCGSLWRSWCLDGSWYHFCMGGMRGTRSTSRSGKYKVKRWLVARSGARRKQGTAMFGFIWFYSSSLSLNEIAAIEGSR